VILLAVDTGGTFTDVVAVDTRTGTYHAAKVPTTPGRLIDGVRAATETAIRLAGVVPRDVERFVHGTTIGTNAVLERRGATTAVLATEGFEDSLEIGRLRRTQMYDLFMDAETPVFLAPRRRRRGVPERIGFDGSIVKPLDEDAVRQSVRSLRDVEGARAFAVCLLFSFRNSAHEHRIRELIRELDATLSVSISSEIDPMFREYERTVVTAFDAYIRPVIHRYVTELGLELEQIGIAAPLQIMQSRGGVTSADLIADRPVSVLLSGPAAGVIGGRHAGSLSGEADLITIDVGGTSADISLVRSDKPLVTTDAMIDTYPLRVPMVDVTTIGAGGGSIAWVDSAGNFRVGPQSAGADPGPACYGRGGTEATVTDASLVLGYLNPDSFAGGSLRLDPDAAQRAVERFASKLGLQPVEAAAGIHRVVNSRMADAIRLVSIRRGYDPREFALVLLGGAGPVHGGRLAADLAISRVIVPALPGVLSALGLLVASIEHEEAVTVAVGLGAAAPDELETTFASLERQVAKRMRADHVPEGETTIQRSADGRYAGQAYTLQIPLDAPTSRESLAAYGEAFHAAHHRVYGHANRDSVIELVNARVVESWAFPRLEFHPAPSARRHRDAASRQVYFDELGGYTKVPVCARESLDPGTSVAGPAIVEQSDSTLVLYPGHVAVVESTGNLIVTAAPGNAPA
jgi:N-methylhydantoinase A/oxoprolinase/acetone carboxylase beta subunit